MTKFTDYSANLAPTIREVNSLKEVLKEFKKTDEKALELQEIIKEAQEYLKKYLEEHTKMSSVIEQIKDLGKDLKEGYAAAAKGTGYKPADIGAFLQARAKDEGVKKVILKGIVFDVFEGLLV